MHETGLPETAVASQDIVTVTGNGATRIVAPTVFVCAGVSASVTVNSSVWLPLVPNVVVKMESVCVWRILSRVQA